MSDDKKPDEVAVMLPAAWFEKFLKPEITGELYEMFSVFLAALSEAYEVHTGKTALKRQWEREDAEKDEHERPGG